MSLQPGLSDGQQSEHSALQSDVITCNNVPMVRERVQPALPEAAAAAAAAAAAPNKEEYVYDIYYMNNATFDFHHLENILAVEAFNDSEELYGGKYGEGREEVYDDEDDSNDEDNWRNDYPDEDPRIYENGGDCYDRDGTSLKIGCLRNNCAKCWVFCLRYFLINSFKYCKSTLFYVCLNFTILSFGKKFPS